MSYTLSRAELYEVVEAAISAPSILNTQPWRFRAGAVEPGHFNVIDLWADKNRQLVELDPECRELLISCGAALFNLEIAIAAVGRSQTCELNPDPTREDWLARVVLRGEHPPTKRRSLSFRLCQHVARVGNPSTATLSQSRLLPSCEELRNGRASAWRNPRISSAQTFPPCCKKRTRPSATTRRLSAKSENGLDINLHPTLESPLIGWARGRRDSAIPCEILRWVRRSRNAGLRTFLAKERSSCC